MRDGRLHAPALTAGSKAGTDGTITLRAPSPGLWRGGPEGGSVVGPGASIGELEVLGVLHRLLAPRDAVGLVVQSGATRARTPVGFGDTLLVLDPAAAAGAREARESTTAVASATSGLVLRAPSAGRYYAQSGPGKPPFVQVGDVLEAGRTVALLEVMKTYNRVTYAVGELPERARVVRIVAVHESDLAEGDVILALEAV